MSRDTDKPVMLPNPILRTKARDPRCEEARQYKVNNSKMEYGRDFKDFGISKKISKYPLTLLLF
jgi:hypothetical protein